MDKAHRSTRTVHVRYWKAGGWHLHVRYPDGSWERRVWTADKWYEVDIFCRTLEHLYGEQNVSVTG